MASYTISNGGTLDTNTGDTPSSTVVVTAGSFSNPTSIEFLNSGGVGGVLILSDNSVSSVFTGTAVSPVGNGYVYLGGTTSTINGTIGTYITNPTINATIKNFEGPSFGIGGDQVIVQRVRYLFDQLDVAGTNVADNEAFAALAAGAANQDEGILILPGSNGSMIVESEPGKVSIGSLDANEKAIISEIVSAVFGTTAAAQNVTLQLEFVSRPNPNANAGFNFVDAVLSVAGNNSGQTVNPCFGAGTRILTIRGEVAVEALQVGDVVITESGEDAPIIWIGRREVAFAGHPRPETVRPVVIEPEALGDGVPSRRLTVSPDHALLLDGVLVPAKALLNWTSIRQDAAVEQVTYYHIELPSHGIVFAEGAAAESFLDTGHRAAFEDQDVALHPEAFDAMQARRAAESCAKLVFEGPELAAIRQRLAARQIGVRLAGAGD